MGRNLYVGNLSYRATEQQLRELFEQVGEVDVVSIIMDRATGRPRGFGFVTMGTDDVAVKAITDLNGKEFLERAMIVNEARPKGEGISGPR